MKFKPAPGYLLIVPCDDPNDAPEYKPGDKEIVSAMKNTCLYGLVIAVGEKVTDYAEGDVIYHNGAYTYAAKVEGQDCGIIEDKAVLGAMPKGTHDCKSKTFDQMVERYNKHNQKSTVVEVHQHLPMVPSHIVS